MKHNFPPASVTRLRTVRPVAAQRPPRVLFVDDERLVQRAFARGMRRRGLDVTTASSGREALELAEGDCFDVLVTDLSMPDMDGISLIEQLVQRGFELGFVVATGHGELYVRGEYALTDLEVHVVDKPWNDVELVALIERLAAEQRTPAARAS